jgi:hypothetical protein
MLLTFLVWLVTLITQACNLVYIPAILVSYNCPLIVWLNVRVIVITPTHSDYFCGIDQSMTSAQITS